MAQITAREKGQLDVLQRGNNFPGFEKMVKLAKTKFPDISRQQIKYFLDHDTTNQITKVQHKSSAGGHIVSFIPNEFWQMDIFDLSRYMISNDEYRYLLVCVDVFSRKAYVEPLKLKTSESVATAFTKMTSKVKPRSILADHDTAFQNEPFQKLISREHIALNLNALNDHRALGIIDNFARRLKFILTKTFLHNKTTKWINRIEHIIRIYNNTQHSALNDVAPNDAVNHREDILNINIDKSIYNKTVSDLSVGDKVRKTLLKQNHGIIKGTDPRFSSEVYTVEKVTGQTITLTDGSRLKRTDLLKVPHDAESSKTNVITEERKLYKVYKSI